MSKRSIRSKIKAGKFLNAHNTNFNFCDENEEQLKTLKSLSDVIKWAKENGKDQKDSIDSWNLIRSKEHVKSMKMTKEDWINPGNSKKK